MVQTGRQLHGPTSKTRLWMSRITYLLGLLAIILMKIGMMIGTMAMISRTGRDANGKGLRRNAFLFNLPNFSLYRMLL
jgi:hypothetical protein